MIIICAPSGAGKTTIIKKILSLRNDLEFSISATNRKIRPNEIDGKDYYFFTTEDFKKKIINNEFIEWEEVYENVFYGTLKSEIERISKLGKHIIFDVDVVGAVNIKKLYTNNALLIFIMPPDIQTLKERLLKRSTDTLETINKRVAKASREIDYYKQNIKWFDKTVINDKLDDAVNQINNCINNFLKK